jgi:hypothetical protein
MSILITLLTVFLSTTDAEVDAFRSTAPRYLTTETAREHLVYARVAAAEYGVDADLLLAIAWFESRYTVNAIGPTVRGKRACGVMQPIMEGACPKDPSLLGGYLQGAWHVQTWLKAARGDMKTAMLGYGGGYALIDKCKQGPLMVERGGRDVDLCTIADIRVARARYIRRILNQRSAS